MSVDEIVAVCVLTTRGRAFDDDRFVSLPTSSVALTLAGTPGSSCTSSITERLEARSATVTV